MEQDEQGTELEPQHYTQADRDMLIEGPAPAFRKRARIVALPAVTPFTVETDRGVMSGEPGDMLVTNHPEDDPGSDLWTISRERFEATYELDGGESGAEALMARALRQLRARQVTSGNRHQALAITKLEEALLWLGQDARQL